MPTGSWRSWFAVLGAAAVALVLLLLVPVELWARAGGGGGYSGGGGGFGGGGGGFSGGGGGGGDGGGIIYLLIWLCVEHPIIGVPVVIAVVLFMIFGARRADEGRRGNVIRRGGRVRNVQVSKGSLQQLVADDPAFKEQTFYDRVSDAFVKIQDAWSRQDLSPVRPFVSDGIYERFSLQFLEQQDFGYRAHVSNVVVHQILLAQVVNDDDFEQVTVRINASCVAYRVSLSSGDYVSGNRNSETFVEYWSFLRRKGVKTKEGPGLMEGFCPNCGAEIALNQSAKCASCDSLLRSGQFDWVMSEITQECEWFGGTDEAVAGQKRYRHEVDSGCNVQHLEDRASVMFWRKVMADRLGSTDPLAKMADSKFVEQYAASLGSGDAQREYFGDCAVGSVDVRGVFRDTDRDVALVEVRWSGTKFTAARKQTPKRTHNSHALRSLLVLQRNHGVSTDVSQSVSSSHCPACGAPETTLVSHACEFCGEVLNTGAHDWVLAELLPAQGDQARQYLLKARTYGQQPAVGGGNSEPPVVAATAEGNWIEDHTPHGTELMIWAVKMALVDHKLDDQERQLLERVARHRKISPEQLETLIEAASQGHLDAPQPPDMDHARTWLTAMADMSLADGQVNKAEYEFLCQAGAQLNLSSADIRLLLRRRKAWLYRQSRRWIREARRQAANGHA